MTPPNRPTWSKLAGVVAQCQGCGWTAATVNGLALAAIHHDQTGHVVRIELTTNVVYGDADKAARDTGQTTLEDHLAPADQGGPT